MGKGCYKWQHFDDNGLPTDAPQRLASADVPANIALGASVSSSAGEESAWRALEAARAQLQSSGREGTAPGARDGRAMALQARSEASPN